MNQTTNKTQTTGSSVRTRHMVQTAIFGSYYCNHGVHPFSSDISRLDLPVRRSYISRLLSLRF